MFRLKALLIFILTLFLFACSKPGQSLEDIDMPQALEEGNIVSDPGEEAGDALETVERELFLIDAQGQVVSQRLEVPKQEQPDVANQVLQYLITDGPVSDIIPNGFSPVLPAGTEILSLNLEEDGTITVDLSKDFADYEADREIKILEAMTYTLTQFPSIERMKLQMEGRPLNAMPVNGSPISDGYTREKGINLSADHAVDLLESELVTVFYPREYNDSRYYVPVTQYVEKQENLYQAVMDILMEGQQLDSSVMNQVFDPKAMLVQEPKRKNKVLQLHFNEFILEDLTQGIISDEVMETLVRTFTGLPNIEAIEVKVNHIDEIFNEQGEKYDKPVSAQVFMPLENR